MSLSMLNYLSMKRDEDFRFTLNEQRLKYIRARYNEIYPKDNKEFTENQLKKLTLKKLAAELNILEDETNMEFVDICIREKTEPDAIDELREKFKAIESTLPSETPTTAPSPPLTTTHTVTHSTASVFPSIKQSPTNTQRSAEPVKLKDDDLPEKIDQITCLIYKNLNRPEVDDFIEKFLFQQVQQQLPQGNTQSGSRPRTGTHIRVSPKGTILDLFVRQQLADRNLITCPGERTKFRLVEPVSLTDEFSTWTYDNFEQLFDFWLTLDQPNNQPFPNRWQLGSDAVINYRIISDETSSSFSTTQIRRPSSKSLDAFILDICAIEDNNMYTNWYESLFFKEQITTYSHLSNLTEKEWDGIKSLTVNTLKTIRFYVDQEKQLGAVRRKKTNEDESKEPELTRCELLAKLHMIKLYITRQLEHVKGIRDIPQLEHECVEGAFEEMRKEGYEDDGLFDSMKLFFQPLTISDDELKISDAEIEKANRGQVEQQKKLEQAINKANERFSELYNQVHDWYKLIAETKQSAAQEKAEYEKDMQQKTLSYDARTKLNLQWQDKEKQWRKEIDFYKQQILTVEQDMKKIESTSTETENLLRTVIKNLKTSQTAISRKLIQLHRGFIMYGPPGTGKSYLMSKLSKKIGIAMLAPALAAGNLERSYVGQSEALISSLCRRANRLPHLICCLSIDEVDSLAPRRDEKSSEGKVSKISVLLSVLEGAENIPNLMLFSATNLLHRMDEAFLRRMTGKFFVGRPSSESRKKILSKIPKTILSPKVLEVLVVATTNFSGSALSRLVSKITTEHRCKRRLNPNYEITEELALILADTTAINFQLKMGLDTLPRLQLRNLYDRKQLQNSRLATTITNQKDEVNNLDALHLPKNIIFTGKIIINLHDRCVRIEAINIDTNRKYVIQEDFRDTEQSLQQLLERVTTYGTDRNVQLLQLIDLNLLSSKGANDEQKVSEILKECYDESVSYRRSMIVYDLDSLIGVNRSESDSSTGISESTSVVNQRIYLYVTTRFGEAKIENSNTDTNLRTERWAIAIVRDPFLLKKFTNEIGFTLTDAQQEDEEEEHRKATETLACVKCRDYYIESENKMGQCTYHDGFIYDNSNLHLTKYRPSDALEALNRDEFLVLNQKMAKEEMEQRKTRMKYICCGAILQTGAQTGGCKKGKHGFNDLQARNNRSELEDGDIKVFEDACFENVRYNQRHNDLFAKRRF
ncbi:unnamed protein product [Didymodactylos carnosus]|uniref:AAA+ ATPase domain-containing protein n=1 Tax=Didymodactylos carnosus TaxID=1234261 RepID=A0A8S2DAQ6_9BILA|nr:unnamed protein product [Didymodactylos carnosus]CAF3663317.1 unnamed protein product [Didymodactylos carnosus]